MPQRSGKRHPTEHASKKSKSGAKRESAAITARWQWQSTAGVARRNANAGKTQQEHACRAGMHAACSVQRAACRGVAKTATATRRRCRQARSTGSKPTCFLLVLVLAARNHRGDGRHGAVGRTAGLGSRGVLLGFLGQLLVALFFGHKFSRYRLEIRLVEAMVSDKSARRNDTRRHPCVQSCLA